MGAGSNTTDKFDLKSERVSKGKAQESAKFCWGFPEAKLNKDRYKQSKER